MKARDLKYLLAYVIPLATFYSLSGTGWTSYFTVILAFGIIPIVEMLAPQWKDNYSEGQKEKRSHILYFDILLFLNLLWVYGVLWMYFSGMASDAWTLSDWFGKSLSVGIMLGSNGINVAHELGHKTGRIYQISSRFLLWPTLYGHFTTEHNFGHHLKVGTPEDPATSRYGEWLFAFWFRTITKGYQSAWNIRLSHLKNETSLFKILRHPAVDFICWPLLFPILVYFWFGIWEMAGSLLIALVGILLLETINYVEHYGLTRQKLDGKRYKPVETFHSWNSNHEVGRVVLYELTRHSDHHYKAYKKYQILDHHDESPQLPFGYPTSILLALFPPVWFRIMNPLVVAWRNKNLN